MLADRRSRDQLLCAICQYGGRTRSGETSCRDRDPVTLCSRRAGAVAYWTRRRRGRHVSVQQYDEIGEAFEGFKSLPLTRYGEVPSFLGMVGDVSGKSILDLACGTGFYLLILASAPRLRGR
jgi:hypothetical protein